MNIGRCLPLLVALGAATLAACDGNPIPKPTPEPKANPAPVAAPATAPAAAATSAATGSASVKAFVDPATGELRAPTEAEQKAAAATAAATRTTADLKADAPIVGKPIGNGVVEYEVGSRGMVDEVACVQKDGSVTMRCPPAGKPASKSK